MRVSLFFQCRLFRRAADAIINQNTKLRSHFIISMATLIAFNIIALSVNSIRNIKLRTMIIIKIESIETTIVTFIEAIINATAVLRVDKIELK